VCCVLPLVLARAAVALAAMALTHTHRPCPLPPASQAGMLNSAEASAVEMMDLD
jgi:hypothetical protein